MSNEDIKHPPVRTVNEVKALKAEAKPYEARDAALRGGYVIKYPSGALAYCVRYRIHNQKRKLTLGRLSLADGGLATMRAKARKALTEVDAARHSDAPDPVAARRAARAKRIVAEATARAAKEGLADASQPHPDSVEHAIDRFKKLYLASLRTGAAVGRVMEREVVGRWRGRALAEITSADVHALLDEIHDRAPIQANRVAAYLSKFFKWAKIRGIIANNPVIGGIARPEKDERKRKRKRALVDRELALVWKAAEGMGYPFGKIIQLLILTGQRKSEISDARWPEIGAEIVEGEFVGKCLSLSEHRTKNKNEHFAPLSLQALAILESLPRYAGCDLIFTTTQKTAVSGFSRVKRNLDKAVAELNGGEPIPPWTIHDIRRSCAVGLQRLKVETRVIERALNHSSGTFAGIVGTYQVHDFAKEKHDAHRKWGAHVEDIVADDEKVVRLREATP